MPKKYFIFSELQELEVRICVQPNFPIIFLILLNGFHKFQRSRGLNSSVRDYLAGQTDRGKLAKSPLAEEILTHLSRDFPRGAGEDKVF